MARTGYLPLVLVQLEARPGRTDEPGGPGWAAPLGAAEREQAAAVQALLGAGTKVNPTNPTDDSQNEAEYIFAEMHGFSLHLESTACMGWQSITASDWL